jgi:glucosamine-6-phosphate deaminase
MAHDGSRTKPQGRRFQSLRGYWWGQGGQGDIKHWAFNDPLPRAGRYSDAPPTPAEYLALNTRVVDLHPVTIMQNARTSGGGQLDLVPTQAVSVGPVQTWRAERVSIWQAGTHDSAYGMRLTTLMIGKKVSDSAVPISLLAPHPNVQFIFYHPAVENYSVEMHRLPSPLAADIAIS